MKIRPLQGQVLLYMDPPETESSGGIKIPDQAQERAQVGKVLKTGIWKLNRLGHMVPYPVRPGDRVIVNARVGRWLHHERERLKIVPMERILAVLDS